MASPPPSVLAFALFASLLFSSVLAGKVRAHLSVLDPPYQHRFCDKNTENQYTIDALD